MRISRNGFEILSFIFQKLKRSCDNDHAPFRDNLSSVGWDSCYDQHVHQIWSLYLKPFQRYRRGTKSLKWVTWCGHAHFRDSLSSVGWDLLRSNHMPNLKCLRLSATKKWKAMPNVKILLLSHPMGPAFVAKWLRHSAAMCSRAWRAQWPGFDSVRARPSTKELFLMIPMHMMNREIIPGR